MKHPVSIWNVLIFNRIASVRRIGPGIDIRTRLAFYAISVAVFIAVLSATPAMAARAQLRGVQVTRIDFDGWRGCARITNGSVEAIVVPQIGRIMAFQFEGQPSSNVLYISSSLAGRTGATSGLGPRDWANFGGEKVWPSPQSDWPRYIGGTWPPDPSTDGEPYKIVYIRDGVTLRSPVSAAFGLQVVRTITMTARSPDLHITDEFRWLRRSARARRLPNGKLGIWSVTQTRPDGTIFVPVRARDLRRFPAGFVTFDAKSRPVASKPVLPTGWAFEAGMLVGKRDPATSHKIGAADSSGWIASLYDGQTLFTERFSARSSAADQPDDGCRGEVYTNAGAAAYIELETLGPLETPRPGTTAKFRIDWSLTRMPMAPTGANAASAVSRAEHMGPL